MSKQPNFSAELHQLCSKLREGELTPQDAERLNAMLRESKAARRFYRSFMALASALETRATLQDAVDTSSDSERNIEALFELLQYEQQAEVLHLPKTPASVVTHKHQPERKSMGWHEVAGASTYLLRHTAQSRPVRWIAAAAVVLLGVTLFIVMSLQGNTTTPRTVERPNQDPADPQARFVVATLTAEHGAEWDRQPTEFLHAGQQFMLLQGLAEIKTARGAIAVIQAPATIELLDNDNALVLHAGKLVGICESESSKGFLVRTPNLDVTDIGTRFGVEASSRVNPRSHVQVYQGAVRVKPSTANASSGEATLFAGQAVEVVGESDLRLAAFNESRFVQSVLGQVVPSEQAANPFGIANPSFEWVSLEDDQLSRKDVPGWVLSGVGVGVTCNPGQGINAYYDLSQALDINGGTVGDMSGRCMFFFSADKLGGSLKQTLKAQAEVGATYSLTVAIGDRPEAARTRSDFAGYVIELLAGDQVLARLDASPDQSPGDGTFTDVTLSHTVKPTDPAGPLGIRLSTNRTEGSRQVTDFDNVRLTATRPNDAGKALPN